MRFTGVIPARFESTRLPGKALIEIAGKPLVQWVYEAAEQSKKLSELCVATDDDRILKAVEGFGGRAVLTSSRHKSGTERVAEVARSLGSDVVVNIQGDEATLEPSTIDAVCNQFLLEDGLEVVSAMVPIKSQLEREDPSAVKVVVDARGFALYFSRSPIPYCSHQGVPAFKHLGIYAYRRELLLRLNDFPDSVLEKAEGLEQLRLLENGVPIRLVKVSADSIGVDTSHDLERVTPLLENFADSQSEAEKPEGEGH